MMEGLLPSMKNTDEDDYFMKPREKVDDDSGTVGYYSRYSKTDHSKSGHFEDRISNGVSI